MPIDIKAYVQELVTYDDSAGHPLRKGQDDNPMIKPGWREIREVGGWHILGEFPEALYENEYPYEDPELRDWRKDNHQPITRGPIRDVMKDMRRMFLESKQRITADDDTIDYIFEPKFAGDTFFEWMFGIPWDMMPLDPNAIICALPVGPGVFDTSIQVDVELKIVESSQIRDRDEEKVSWLSYQPSRLNPEGELYWVVDDTFYYTVEQDEDLKDWIVTEYYKHETGSPLSQVLGGFQEYREGWILYRSFFEGYFPLANDVIDEYSTYKVTHRRLAFPVKWELERDCDAPGCYNGYLEDRSKCQYCNDRGKVSSLHPGQSIQVDTPEQGEAFNVPMGYIDTPDSTFKDMRDSWEQLLERAKEAINARFIMEAQSGKAKEADLEGRFTMFQTVADWFFGQVVQGTAEMIVKLRRPRDWHANIPVVIPPNDFKLKTSEDLLMELQELAKANPTSGMYVETVREFTDKKYGRDRDKKRKVELQLILDPLAGMSNETQNMLVAAGTVDRKIVQRSNFSYHVIEQILGDNPSAIGWPDARWRQEYDKRMDELFPDVDPQEFEVGDTE